MNFRDALLHVLIQEGGYANHPDDPGGATMQGVTQRTYDAYRASKKLPLAPVRHITRAELEEIYERDYWKPSRAENLPPGLRLVHFDCAVNCGVVNAAKMLQEAIGLRGSEIDGIIGPVTLARAHQVDVNAAREEYLWLRARYYARITVKNDRLKTFMAGWIFRLIAIRAAAVAG